MLADSGSADAMAHTVLFSTNDEIGIQMKQTKMQYLMRNFKRNFNRNLFNGRITLAYIT